MTLFRKSRSGRGRSRVARLLGRFPATRTGYRRDLASGFETLESRTLLAAPDSITISAANALAFVGSVDNNNVTVSFSTGTYTISDSVDVIVVNNQGTATVSGSGTNSVTVSGINQLSFDTGGGSDTFNIESTNDPTSVTNTASTAAQTVVVGTTADGVQGIGAALTINNAVSKTGLTVEDVSNTVAVTAVGGTGQLGPISYTTADLSSLAIDGGSGNETLGLSFSGGNPIPQGVTPGLQFSGGGGDNTLDLSGGGFTQEVYTPTAAGSGTISFDTSTTIGFTGLQPINDTVPAASFVLALPTAAGSVLINNGPVVGGVQTGTILSADIPPAFELVNFGAKTNVTIDGTGPGAPDESVGVNLTTRPAGLDTISVNTGSGNDQVQLTAAPNNVSVNTSTGSGNDTVSATLLGLAPAPVINYADGGTGTNALVVDVGGGTATVLAAGDPNLPAGVPVGYGAVVENGHVLAYRDFQSITLNNSAGLPFTEAGTTVNATEGLPVVNPVVATFTYPDLSAKASDFAASINWGDGSPVIGGTVIENAPGQFTVVGPSHTYAEEGSDFLSVVVTSLGTSSTTTIGGVPVTTVVPAGAQATSTPFTQHNLTSNNTATIPSDHQDIHLVNAWGLAAGPTSPFWVSDNGSGLSTLYSGLGVPQSLVVTIPPAPSDPPGTLGTPTGVVFNTATAASGDFAIGGSHTIFLFATEDGTISGWTGGGSATIAVNNSAAGSVYKGLALASSGGANYLYATNFHSGAIEVYDRTFTLQPAASFPFADAGIPSGFAPFGIQAIGGNLYVTYAKQDAAKHDDVRGAGNGYVDEFSTAGVLIRRIGTNGTLDSPWGLAIAPSGFGTLGGDLLVGNFGSTAAGDPNAGQISVFNPSTGAYIGQLLGPDNQPIAIDGLRALAFGNGTNNTSTGTLYFTAGPGDESNGLFGELISPGAAVSVADAALSAQSATITAVEALSTPSEVVANFTDSDPNAAVSDFSATISWGDGTSATGTIAGLGAAPNGQSFSVSGSHTYTEEGAYLVRVVITDAGGSVIATNGQALVTDAPIMVTALSPLFTAGTPERVIAVGSFTDTAGGEALASYSASIDWGDGTAPTSGTLTSSLPPVSPIEVAGSHLFGAPGTYFGSITIKDEGGASTTVPLVTTVNPVNVIVDLPSPTEDVPMIFVPVATFQSVNNAPVVDPRYYAAIINWGDGSPSTLGVVADGGNGTGIVDGSHEYEKPGTYTLHLTLGDAGVPSLVLASQTITVRTVPITIVGILNPASDTGVSNSDKITNDTTPNFVGYTSQGDAIVQLSVQRTDIPGAPFVVGQTVSDRGGFWSITTVPLPDGTYTVTAGALAKDGVTFGSTQILPGADGKSLVVDTVGPKVTGVFFDRQHGQIDITYQDDRSGLDLTTLLDGANYAFSKYRSFQTRYLITSLTATPASSPTGTVTVVATINNGQPLRGGHYFFTIHAQSAADVSGVRDIAGNALDGEFYGDFPSGNNRPGGDFLAEFDAVHNIIFSPLPVNGFASPNVPPGTPAPSFRIGKGPQPPRFTHTLSPTKIGSDKNQFPTLGAAATDPARTVKTAHPAIHAVATTKVKAARTGTVKKK